MKSLSLSATRLVLSLAAAGIVGGASVGLVSGYHANAAAPQVTPQAAAITPVGTPNFAQIAQRHGAAVVNIQARPVATGIGSRKTCQTGIDTANDLSALLDLVKGFASHGRCAGQQTCGSQDGTDHCLCMFFHAFWANKSPNC